MSMCVPYERERGRTNPLIKNLCYHVLANVDCFKRMNSFERALLHPSFNHKLLSIFIHIVVASLWKSFPFISITKDKENEWNIVKLFLSTCIQC